MTQVEGAETRERPATVHDVARVAGVSAQTVSRLLKGYPGIRPETRERVEQAIEELRYRRNRAAQLLRTRKSTRIGAVVHEMFEYGPAHFLRGASAGAQEAGYSLIMVGVDGENEAAIDQAFETFEEEQVAGILAITLTDSVRAVVERRSTDVPILVDPAEAHGDGPSFNEEGAELVAQHLLELGHRSFGIIEGPESWLPARQRRDQFLAVISAAGATCATVGRGDWSAAAGSAAAENFSLDNGITAVFSANDTMAIGFIHGLARHGIRVPQDVSVAGFDDISEAAFIAPPLTTVRPDFENQGRAAIRLLLADIDGVPHADMHHPRGELIARESTASPR